jgi:hypothetical protein
MQDAKVLHWVRTQHHMNEGVNSFTPKSLVQRFTGRDFLWFLARICAGFPKSCFIDGRVHSIPVNRGFFVGS